MITKHGILSGILTPLNIVNKKARIEAAESLIKRASTRVKQAYRIGLQELYADPEEALKKYTDFDLSATMKKFKGANLLWVRCRAIDADVVNSNGDYFSEEELLKEVEKDGKKMPAYKTFETVPIHLNHKNDDIGEARGMVVYSEWDSKEKCVYCTFFIDEDAHPDVGRGIRLGYMKDVSMGARVESGKCSNCGNVVTTPNDYCECLKKHKAKKHPKTGKHVYEENFDVCFIELSIVNDGAFQMCEIEEIYDVDEVLTKAQQIQEKAKEVAASISLASCFTPNGSQEKHAYDECIRTANQCVSNTIKISQSAGTLVGGPIVLGPEGTTDATVQSVLSGLGINQHSGLSVLDLVNLALNFLEVSVINLFSRKDNIDLSHVGKITKSMADLQNTLQDMIDDGIDTSTNPAAMNQGQLQQQSPQQAGQQVQPQGQQSMQQPQGQQISPQTYVPNNSVGKITTTNPNITQTMQNNNSPIGSGFAFSKNLVWSDDRKVVTSMKNEEQMPDNVTKLLYSIKNLQDAIDPKTREKNIFAEDKFSNNGDDNSMNPNNINFLKKISEAEKSKNTLNLTANYEVDDNSGNKIVLSTDRGIQFYHKDKLTNWKPDLDDTLMSELEQGHLDKVSNTLFSQFKNFIKTAQVNKMNIFEIELEDKRDGDVMPGTREQQIDDLREEDENDTILTELVENKQTGNSLDHIQVQLEKKRTNKEVYIRDALIGMAKENNGDDNKTLNEKIQALRSKASNASGKVVITNVLNALTKACFAAEKSPEEILKSVDKLANDENIYDIIALSFINKPSYKLAKSRSKFLKVAQPMLPTPEEAITEQVSMEATDDMNTDDVADAFKVILDNLDTSINKMHEIADKMGVNLEQEELVEDKTNEMAKALVEDEEHALDKDSLKGAISSLAMTSIDSETDPSVVLASFNSLQHKDLVDLVNLNRESQTEKTLSKTASEDSKKPFDILVDWLAKYANYYNVNSDNLVSALFKVASQPQAATKIINNAIASKVVEAEVKVRDEEIKSTTIYCNASDLNGLTVDSPDFENGFREFAIKILSESGHNIDPATFSLTSINVEENNNITATVESRITKSFVPSQNTEAVGIGDASVINDAVDVVESPYPSSIMTDSAKLARSNYRKELIKKAQAQMQGAMPGVAADPLAVQEPLGQGQSEGVMGLEMPQMPEMNEQPDPGQRKPWGSICPQCGSTEVTIANGEGNCNSCNAQLKYKFIVETFPSDSGEASTTEMPVTENSNAMPGFPGGEPAGTEFPAAAPGAGLPQVTGLPQAASKKIVMTKIAYKTDATPFLRATMDGFDKTAEKILPVGMICPACGNREVEKVNKKTFCNNCNTLSINEVKRSKKDPTKLISSIIWW